MAGSPSAWITHKTSVTLTGPTLAVVAELVRDGIRYRTKHLGHAESLLHQEIASQLAKAVEDGRDREAAWATWQLGNQVEAVSEGSKVMENEVIGVAEAAEILGRPKRTVNNWAKSLGGWGGGRGRSWQFRRTDVVAYAAALAEDVA